MIPQKHINEIGRLNRIIEDLRKIKDDQHRDLVGQRDVMLAAIEANAMRDRQAVHAILQGALDYRKRQLTPRKNP